MGLFDWFLGLLRGGNRAAKAELEELRRKIFRLEQQSIGSAEELKGINKRRVDYMEALHRAPTEEDARLWQQRLNALDTQEDTAHARWDQVESDLEQQQTALQNLRNMPHVNVKRVEAEQRRLARLQEERARQNTAEAEITRETQARQTAASRTYQQAVQRTTPNHYLDMWRASKAREVASAQPPLPEQPAAAPQSEQRPEKS